MMHFGLFLISVVHLYLFLLRIHICQLSLELQLVGCIAFYLLANGYHVYHNVLCEMAYIHLEHLYILQNLDLDMQDMCEPKDLDFVEFGNLV